MSFLFPVSGKGDIYYKKSKYTAVLIHIHRSIAEHNKWSIDWGKIRRVKRVIPDITWGSAEYFELIRSMITPFNFHCHKVKKMTNINYCFSMCRFHNKKDCTLYTQGQFHCLGCDKYIRTKECKRFNTCRNRKFAISIVSLYCSELMKLNKVIQLMRYGRGYKKNYKGKGPQLYFNVGRIISSNSSFVTPLSMRIASHNCRKRKKEAQKLRRVLK